MSSVSRIEVLPYDVFSVCHIRHFRNVLSFLASGQIPWTPSDWEQEGGRTRRSHHVTAPKILSKQGVLGRNVSSIEVVYGRTHV